MSTLVLFLSLLFIVIGVALAWLLLAIFVAIGFGLFAQAGRGNE